MITSEELYEWKLSINTTKATSLELAKRYAANEEISKYYMHLANVADVQGAIIERLLRQSEDKPKPKRARK